MNLVYILVIQMMIVVTKKQLYVIISILIQDIKYANVEMEHY